MSTDADESEFDRDMALIKSHAAQLSEHFDSVQVFVTRYRGGETVSVAHGCGNWFARYGQVKDWVVKADARIRAEDDE